MEPVNLKQTSHLFIAADILETAKELQTHLASVPYDNQPEVAAQAIDVLGDPRELYNSKKVFIHAIGARVIADFAHSLTDDEIMYHGTYFGDAYLKGNFSRFAHIRSTTFSSLCLMMVETAVLKSDSNPEFEGEVIRSGVYVPVHAVESVLAA